MSKHKHFRVYVPRIIAGILVIAIIFGVVTLIKNFLHQKPQKPTKKIQTVKLFKPPPPPPPPPPKQERPPEPEIEEKVEEPEPEPIEDIPDAKPDDGSGDDAAGTEGGTGPVIGGGRGTGRKGNINAWYAGYVRNKLLEVLIDHDELRRRAYSAYISVLIDIDGGVSGHRLTTSSGNADIDELLLSIARSRLRQMDEFPPSGKKQRIKFKISSKI